MLPMMDAKTSDVGRLTLYDEAEPWHTHACERHRLGDEPGIPLVSEMGPVPVWAKGACGVRDSVRRRGREEPDFDDKHLRTKSFSRAGPGEVRRRRCRTSSGARASGGRPRAPARGRAASPSSRGLKRREQRAAERALCPRRPRRPGHHLLAQARPAHLAVFENIDIHYPGELPGKCVTPSYYKTGM